MTTQYTAGKDSSLKLGITHSPVPSFRLMGYGWYIKKLNNTLCTYFFIRI